ncbi:MAG TPA: insulinase family protein [Candidatus Latescibacteria bacterium]|nr:insulinase family protein [Candidatus Latescibacterota bacterium]
MKPWVSLCLLVGLSVGCIPRRGETPLSPFTRRVLPNGLTVLVKEVHIVPLVAVFLWARTGSANEPDSLNGISHFFEHMFFKGTERYPKGEMDRIVKRLGGYNNAFTGMEYTGYYIVVPAEHFATALDLLYDAMTASAFLPEEIELERQVIEEEIRRREDSPTAKLHQVFLKHLFEGTPYARPVLGTFETLARIDREHFLKYLRDYYVPNNVVAVIVGDVETGKVVEEVQRRTEVWKPDPEVERRIPKISFVPQNIPRTCEIERDLNQTYWILGFPAPGIGEPEEYPLEVAATVLGSGRSSRLWRRLVEREGLVTTVSSWYWPLRYAGVFGIEAHFPPENRKKVERVVWEEIGRLRDEPVGDAELEKAKTMLLADFAYENESCADIAETLGYYAIVSSVGDALEYPRRVREVTAEQVRKAIRRYLKSDAYTLCVLRPHQEGSK